MADKLEQVLDAAPRIAALLGTVPGVSILATSRERLGIAGEQEYPVPPLDETTAAELFTTRARQVQPDFAPDERIGNICDRLDRLPLAIELASTRVKIMTTEQILTRLEHRFGLLTVGRRDAPGRQSTMKATIDWSYDLLSAAEQRQFRGLGVFAGSFELEAAESVCGTQVDQLQSLVDKSLVRPSRNGRFFLLETTRDYARDRLADNDELAELRRRHADWFFQVARACRAALDTHGGLFSLPEKAWAERLRADIDNYRAVLAWALEHDIRQGLELAVNLNRSWHAWGHNHELARWLERALSLPAPIEPDLRAEAIYARARALTYWGEQALREKLLTESRELFRQTGNQRREAHVLIGFGHLALYRGDEERHFAYMQQALEMFRRVDEPNGAAHAIHNVGEHYMTIGDYEKAQAALEEALHLVTASGNRWSQATALHGLGDLALLQADANRAENYYRQALTIDVDLDEKDGQMHCLGGLASAAALRHDPARTGRLWTIATIAEDRLGRPMNSSSRQRYQAAIAPIESDPDFQAGIEAGRTAPFEQAVPNELPQAEPTTLAPNSPTRRGP